MKNIVDIEYLLPAIAYADSYGLPHETRTAKEMSHRPPVTGLEDVTQNEYFEDSPPGTWSDDGQQSLATATGLVDARGFDLEIIADYHLREFETSSKGWGKGSARAMELLGQGVSPYETGQDGNGCGALMRLAPLVLWQATQSELDRREKDQQIEAFVRMTHDSDEVVASALMHAGVLEDLMFMRGGLKTMDGSIHLLQRNMHRGMRGGQQLTVSLNRLMDHLKTYEMKPQDLAQFLDNPEKPFSHHDVLITAYAAFFSGNKDYDQVLQRVVSYGGDTDSSAAIVAGMCIALDGKPANWPPADYELLQDRERLEHVSKALADLAIGRF